jgi:hypothetical protein
MEAGGPGERTTRLLEQDPELGAMLRPASFEQARRYALAATVELPRGPTDPTRLTGARGVAYGLLVLDGLLSRSVRLSETTAKQLIGRGDLVEPAAAPDAEALVEVAVGWEVLEPTTVALLDDRFAESVRPWPEVVSALFERLTAQSARIALHCAISQLPRVEERLHALLWLLAERWGRVTADGVVVPLKLTHEMLGQLIGARRPTVSLAVKLLEQRGEVLRRSDGAWLLVRSGPRAAAVGSALAVGVGAGAAASRTQRSPGAGPNRGDSPPPEAISGSSLT